MKIKFLPKKNHLVIDFTTTEAEIARMMLVFIDKDAIQFPPLNNNFFKNLKGKVIKKIILDISKPGITKEAILELLPSMMK